MARLSQIGPAVARACLYVRGAFTTRAFGSLVEGGGPWHDSSKQSANPIHIPSNSITMIES
jgi:hypothetical protein